MNGDVQLVGNRVVPPSNPHWDNALTGETNGAEIVARAPSRERVERLAVVFLERLDGDRRCPRRDVPADFDQRHTVNAYVGYRWGGRTTLSARMRYGSNFPIVGYVGEDSAGYVLTTERNGVRLPEYARLDLRADRAFTYRKSRLTLFMEVVNVTNRDNYRANSGFVNTDLAAGLRADRESVSVAAGGRSVDRVLNRRCTGRSICDERLVERAVRTLRLRSRYTGNAVRLEGAIVRDDRRALDACLRNQNRRSNGSPWSSGQPFELLGVPEGDRQLGEVVRGNHDAERLLQP